MELSGERGRGGAERNGGGGEGWVPGYLIQEKLKFLKLYCATVWGITARGEARQTNGWE